MDVGFDKLNVIFLLAGLLFFLIGFMLLIATIRAIMKSIASKKWPITQGVISKSEIHEDKNPPRNIRTPMYKTDIEFTYTVAGRNYKSTKVNFGKKLISMGNSFRSKKSINKYQVDEQVNVHYNPANVKEAVLEPGLHTNLLAGMIFSLLLMAISLIFIRFSDTIVF